MILDVLARRELRLVEIVPVDGAVIQKGLALGWSDFEDAIQAVCALEAEVDYLVTINPQDFSALSIPVVSPAEVFNFLGQ